MRRCVGFGFLLVQVALFGCGDGLPERAVSPQRAVVATIPSAEPVKAVRLPRVSEAPPPAPSAIATSKPAPHEPRDEMVDVPAGRFVMGCAPSSPLGCEKDAQPRHPVWLDAYAIDTYEVTVADYRACLEAKVCEQPRCDVSEEPGDEPMRCASRYGGVQYCQWRGKRLPTEAEWERAARGTDERVFPWGNEAPEGRVCAKADGPCPVGSFPAGVSPVGAHDMAGNVSEWVFDAYHPDYYRLSPVRSPTGYAGPPVTLVVCNGPACGATRGGHWNSDAAGLTTTRREKHALDYPGYPHAGFRCAKSP